MISHASGQIEHLLIAPPKPNWCWSFGGDKHAMTVYAYTLTPPNALQRFLLKYLLSIHWRKL